MTLRIKNTSDIQNLFGLTGGYGAFANNSAIKNNPELIKLLLEKRNRVAQLKINQQRKQFKPNHAQKPTDNETIRTPIKQSDSLPQNVTIVTEANIKKVPDAIYLYSKLNKRYYNIYCQANLLGGWSIIRSWGAINSHLGNYKIVLFDSLEEVNTYIADIIKKKKYTGYEQTINETN